MNDMVDKITEEILNYKNDNDLSWMEVYKEILNNLNMEKEIDNDMLLINVIKKITKLGYDIVDIPFSLEKY